jgi:hypothetical protein
MGESEMTEPMIEEPETEDFTDELSDEALDREGARSLLCVPCGTGGRLVPVTDR